MVVLFNGVCSSQPPETNLAYGFRGRSFLKLGKMDIISPTTRNAVEPVYKPKDGHSLPVGTFTVVNPPMDNKSARKLSPRQSVFRDVEPAEPAETAETSMIHSQNEERNDIHRLFTMLDDLQDEVSSMKKFVNGISTKTRSPGEDPDQNPRDAAGFEAELDLLADSVSQINDRVNEVTALRLEVRMLKRRIQRLEDGSILTQSTHTITGLTQDSAQKSRPSELSGPVPARPHSIAQIEPFVPETFNTPPQLKPDETTESPVKSSLGRDEPVISDDIEMIIESRGSERGDAARNSIPHNIRSDASSTSPNPSINKVPETQQTYSNPTQSDTTISMIYEPPKRFGFPTSNSSSSSSRMSSLPTESPPRPKTPPTTRLKRQQPPSGISLNNHEIIPGSDPEDEDYDPNSVPSPQTPSTSGNLRTRGPGRGRRGAQGVALSPPEWEQPGWGGATTPRAHSATRSTRGRGITRRGVGGRPRGPVSEPRPRRSLAHIERGASEGETRSTGRSSRHRVYDNHGNRLRANGLPDQRFMKRSRDEEGNLLTSKGTPDGRSVKRPRDENGYIIRANGQLDGRSLVRGKKGR